MAKKKKARKRKAAHWFLPDPGETDQRTIAIDMEIHKLIEGARASFEETDSDILRRLLGLDGAVPGTVPMAAAVPHGRRAKGGGATDGGWSKIGRHGRPVMLPDGTRLRAAYGGRTIEAEIRSGKWAVGEATFNSPSAALNAFARTSEGRTVNLNGWRHWEALVPGSQIWVRIGDL